jgi:NAD(P)-dependent dehydrogenase (short-subunit alcohol dehydrogenase family)
MDFRNKNVLITGGSRGIGKATALAFANAGARVAINFMHDNEAATQTIQALKGDGHIAIKADITQPNSVERMVTHIVQEFGSIDILVNNAGIYRAHPIDQCDYETWQAAWQQTLSLNLTGVANVTYCIVQQMIAQGGGRIVNVSSRGAFRGEPEYPAYGASKAALNAMSQSLAQALAKYQIFIGVVAPGFVETDMAKEILASPIGAEIRAQSPMNRVAMPEEVANAILFLASEGTTFLTGAILDINGASYLRS